MKKITILLFVLMSFFTAYAGSNDYPKTMEPFKNYELIGTTSLEYNNYLKKFVGDTIVMQFDTSASLEAFSVENPDTVWIKKRPKKNPELGKHYILNKAYKGVQVNDKFVTPATAINGKPFAVYSVTPQSSYGRNVNIKLVDLENLDMVNFHLYESFPETFTFTSAKTQRLIRSLEGQKVYYCNDFPTYSISAPEFTECTYLNGDFHFELTKSSGTYSHSELNAFAQIRVQDASGTVHAFSPIKSTSYQRQVILSENEYDSKFKLQTIETKVDFSIFDEELDFPFSFVTIFGKPTYGASVSQTIDPAASYKGSSTYLDPRYTICIGDKVSIGEREYYKACLNGKAFYIGTKSVDLTPKSQAQLDSLMTCSPELRAKFFKRLHALNFQDYVENLDNGVKALESYAQYGLAIPNWSVYDMSEYTDGTGIKFSFLNPTKKVIKYITINFQGYNAVDDPVGKTLTKRCVGPIEPDETGTYEFDYAWFTDVVEYAKIKSILVQYKDGTSKTISNPKSIMFGSDLQNFFYSSDPVSDFK
jgi:hypothetical protein